MTTDVLEALKARGIDKVKLGGFDVDGVLRGKYVSIEKLKGILAEGFGFCDVIFGWDITDTLYDNAQVTGWHTGYPDAHAVLDPSTLRFMPWEPGVAALLCDFRGPDGGDHPACPRSLLRRVIAKAASMGYQAKLSCEFEFWLFKETPGSLQQKDFRGLEPVSPGMFGYSWVREGQNASLIRAVLDQMRAFDVEIEAMHTETGPGVYEVAIRYDDALRAADKAALFKTHMKQIAHEHGLAVTFMAKWNESLPGSSGHLHQSLWREGKSVFAAPGSREGVSETMRHYIGGLLALAPELTALYSPTVNSYKRYVPGVWAPLTPTWGVENRTAAVRVIAPGHATSTRVEYRQTAADINPYIAMATCLAAGLWGIENRVEPGPEAHGDASAPQDDGRTIPRSLAEATERLSRSEHARQILGEAFVDHYVRTRQWEVRQYEKAVTSWELRRYFEAVLRMTQTVYWSFPTRIVFGPGSVAQVGREAKRLNGTRALVVADAGVVSARLHEPVIKSLEGSGVVSSLFTDVDPNPIESNVTAGVAAFRAKQADLIVALGGGSPLDVAKLIRLKAFPGVHELPLVEYDDATGGDRHVTSRVPPMIAIPTTAGTGSEVGRSGVVTLEANHRKTVIFSPFLMPNVAVLDPELTRSMPAKITAATGFDALTHCLEAYVSKGDHPLADSIALGGLRLVARSLRRVVEQPGDLDARGDMMKAAMMGAVAFQKGLGACHSLAHPLSSECGLHHGLANALCLPAVVEFNAEAARERLAEAAAALGAPPTPEGLSGWLRKLKADLGLPSGLREAGVRDDQLEKLADKALEDACHTSNPRPCSRDDLLGLYKASM